MSQFISLEEAITMTTLYRDEKENILAEPYQDQGILARCETFDRAVLDTLLAKAGCEAIRIYYGMDENLKVHAILVAVNESDEDILLEEEDDIAERAIRCPNDCPPPSDLNP